MEHVLGPRQHKSLSSNNISFNNINNNIYDKVMCNDIEQHDATRITNLNMFMGSSKTIVNAPWLEENKIIHVLCLIKDEDCVDMRRTFKFLPIEHKSNFNISKYFNECYNWMVASLKDAAQKKSNILIYCDFGDGPSAAIVCVYFLQKFLLNVSTIVQFLRGLRPQINLSPGFLDQLRHYQRFLYKRQLLLIYKNKKHKYTCSISNILAFLIQY